MVTRHDHRLSSRAKLAVLLVSAAVGWLAIIGVFFVGRRVANYVEAVLWDRGLNEIAPGGARPADDQRRP
jgi:hypothetical protein